MQKAAKSIRQKTDADAIPSFVFGFSLSFFQMTIVLLSFPTNARTIPINGGQPSKASDDAIRGLTSEM
jgi:hypothetical protein